MNTPVAEKTVYPEIPFSSLSELMLSLRQERLVVARHADSLVHWVKFRTDVLALVQTLQASPFAKWALCFDDSYHFAVAFMAAAHAGKQIILPGNHQPAALAELVCHFDAVLHDRSALCELDCPQQLLPLVPVSASATCSAISIAEKPVASELAELVLSDVTITLFTSGSSGQPKAIIKTLDRIDAEIAQLEQTWGTQLRDSIVVSTVSHQHIYGLLFRVLWPLCAGRAFDRIDLSYPEQVMAQADPDTTLITSPALLKRLGAEQATQPYRAVFSSGGPLAEAAARQSFELFEQLPIEVFGSTETGGIGFRQQQQANTPWQLFDVIDMALNAEGCLRLSSPFIDPESWYQTSDQCQLLGDRQFMLLGRTDRVVKVEEKRVSLTEVEQRLCQLSWVDEAAVLTLDDTNRLIIAAVITLTGEGQQHMAAMGKGQFWLALRQQLRQWLEPVGIPRRFRIVDEIPLNSQGKRLVRELEQFFK
ncbi:AMP-binding protein [Photobacterium sp. SDRW27]|uniref:AMP-binding protein n=1 Tax=Photobacterium obscurum TaxID=2829490 RepID=UPI0022441130|nr:AMP-binding protein [Photobacterium obscurum]MCW8328977.1 AMP-binding protein [Photobacterium obscurum]